MGPEKGKLYISRHRTIFSQQYKAKQTMKIYKCILPSFHFRYLLIVSFISNSDFFPFVKLSMQTANTKEILLNNRIHSFQPLL